MGTTVMHDAEDINMVELWLRRDSIRWAAGAIGGLFAGLVAIFFAALMASLAGQEFWFPIKLMGSMVLGAGATEIGMHLGAIVTGLIVFEAIAMLYGFIYAHFVRTNHLPSLLGMGVVWGLFSWIFLWNLYFQSFKPIFNAQVSSGAAFAVSIVYGLALTSIGFFDRTIRGKDL